VADDRGALDSPGIERGESGAGVAGQALSAVTVPARPVDGDRRHLVRELGNDPIQSRAPPGCPCSSRSAGPAVGAIATQADGGSVMVS